MDSGTVHIWTGRFSKITRNSAEASALLSEDEIDRASKFVFDRDREKYIAGRAALKRILALEMECSPSEVRFVYNAHGKPLLRDDSVPRIFNVAHAGDILCIAIAPSHGPFAQFSLGIDVEFIQTDVPFEDVARSHFSPLEVERLLNFDDRRGPFFRCWTRKEAYIKARGQGVAYGLDAFGVSLDDQPITSPAFDTKNDHINWRLHSWFVDEDHLAALAVNFDAAIEHHLIQGEISRLAS